MRKKQIIPLDFIVDKLTNSIQNVITGDSFPTTVSVVNKTDINMINAKGEWVFDWGLEFRKPEREVYKLTISNNPEIFQGLISVEIKSDHLFIHLLESAPFNKGSGKVYAGVPGNLVAFAAKLSFQRGHEGNIAFIAKTKLIRHYEETLGAKHFGGRLMIIDSAAALILIGKYFEEQRV